MKHKRRWSLILTAAAGILVMTPIGRAGELSGDLLKVFEYRAIGPTRQGGRYVDFAVPEGRPYTFYAATATGGLWKSTDNGITYECVFQDHNVTAIGAVAVAPSNPDAVWVGTGEGNNSRSVYSGRGVFKSADAGKNWTHMGLEASRHIGRVVVDPRDENTVYVAALGALYSENEERGLYKTTDGGLTWEKVLGIFIHGKHIGVVDVALDPLDPDIVYAASYDKVRRPWTFNLGGPGSGIHKSTDGGRTWEKLTQGLPGGMLGRIGLAIYPKNPDILYAVIENANKPGMSDEERHRELLEGKSSSGIIGNEVYRTDDGGATWRKVSEEKANLGGSPPYYYGQIRVDPNDPDRVYNLMVSVAESRDGGKTWSRPFRYGGDNHAMWINPENSLHMLLGHDHGMGVTFDGGKNWYNPDNIPLAQFYAIGVDMDYPYHVYGGTQDNGSLKGPGTKRNGGPIYFEDWMRVGGGDGFYNVVDPYDSRWLYNESQFGVMSRRDQWTGEATYIQPRGDSLRFNWNTPILISPHDSRTLYAGCNYVMKSTNRGDSWEAVSPDLTNPDPARLTVDGKGGDGNIQYSTITAIDESPLEPGVIWAGTDDGNVQVTRDGGKTWTLCNDRIPDFPGYWVSRVTASNHESGTAYLTLTGYRRDDSRPFVYRTADYGETWISLAGGLPDEPVNVIREHPGNGKVLIAGTDLAVYVSIDGGSNWTRMKNNMPHQPVHDLVIHPRELDLIVGTHGRGMFITDIYPLHQINDRMLRENVFLFEVQPRVKWVPLPDNAVSSRNYHGPSEPVGSAIYYYLRKKTREPVRLRILQGDQELAVYEGETDPGLHRVVWNFTRRVRRSDEEIERLRERMRGWRELRESDKYRETAMPPGIYKAVLEADGKIQTRTLEVKQDIWYRK